MIIDRIITKQVKNALEPSKVVVLYGPRQVGKTTLIKSFLEDFSEPYIFADGDQLRYRRVLESQNSKELKSFIGKNNLLVIDEAQRIENIGLSLKIIVDNFPEKKVLVTGSASLDLANKISEPLTGRKKTFLLYPVSFQELANWLDAWHAKDRLEEWLVYGSYPEVLTHDSKKEKENYLAEIVSSYLYKDILEFSNIRKSEKIVDLLRLLAFQIGQEVSIAELATNLGINRRTVEKYLNLLEKAFVIFRVSGFSRNLRKEIVKNNRYYFYDNGVRNALIENFNSLNLRNDKGQLWENYIWIERKKYHQNKEVRVNSYFWRTYEQKEIDLIEETGGKINGFEIKWQGEIKKSVKEAFKDAYKNSTVTTINKKNFSQFLH